HHPAELAGCRRHRGRKSHVQRCTAGRHRHLSGAEYRCIRAVLRQSASAIRCSEIFLARHADDRSGNLHRLARLQDQDALRRTDARDDDRRRGRGLDTRVLWPRLQPAPQYEGAPDHGYPGQNEILLAMENGEVEAMASPFWSSIKTMRPDWYPQSKI